MCGRYSITVTKKEIKERFFVDDTIRDTIIFPRYNIAPSQNVVAIIVESNKRVVTELRWGLIPSWVKDLKKTKPMINARYETIAEKPYFKSALNKRRCLIPADGFYEWKDTGNGKQPMYFTLEGHKLFSFAGLWDQWTDPNGEVHRTCTIITVPANDFMSPIHERMPAILTPDAETAWLDPNQNNTSELLSILSSHQDNHLKAYPVTSIVNSPKIDSPDCIEELSDS